MNERRGGLTFITALGLIFITLKLCHEIDWSWPLVLLPFWIQGGILVGFGIVVLIGGAGFRLGRRASGGSFSASSDCLERLRRDSAWMRETATEGRAQDEKG